MKQKLDVQKIADWMGYYVNPKGGIMKQKKLDVQKIADYISKGARYERSKLPKETDGEYLNRMAISHEQRLIHSRKRSFLGIPVYDYIPNQERPDGWSIGVHMWNKGITFSYRCAVIKKIKKMMFLEDEQGSIHPIEYMEAERKPTFWERRFPKHFTFTIAKLAGKWRASRAYCPFMEASLKALPVLSKEEWAKLDSDHIKIYEKGELQ